MDIAYVFCFQKCCTGGCHLSEVLPGDHLYRLLQVQGVQPPPVQVTQLVRSASCFLNVTNWGVRNIKSY